MARILANPFGELRGKAGGSVFSRNRAGQFMRVYVKPAQSNTQAQLSARGRFGAVSQQYSTLGVNERQSWNLFATNGYNPLKVTNTGQFTGQQCYIGVVNSLESSANSGAQGDYCTLGTTTPIAGTDLPFVNNSYAPVLSVVSAVQGDGGVGPVPLAVTNGSMPNYHSVKFDLLFGLTGVGIAAGQLVDANGKPITIGVYLSDVIKAPGYRPKNKFQNFIGNLAIPSFTSPLTAGTLGITVNITDFNYNAMKRIPQTGDYYLATMLAIGEDGTISTIGSLELYTS